MLHILPMTKEMDRHTIYIVNCRRPPLNIFIQQKTHTTKPPQPPPYIQHIENLRIYVNKQYIYTHKVIQIDIFTSTMKTSKRVRPTWPLAALPPQIHSSYTN